MAITDLIIGTLLLCFVYFDLCHGHNKFDYWYLVTLLRVVSCYLWPYTIWLLVPCYSALCNLRFSLAIRNVVIGAVLRCFM